MQPPPSGRALLKRSPKESSTPPAMILSAKAVDVAHAEQRDADHNQNLIRSPHPRIAQPRSDPGWAPVSPPCLDVLSPGVLGGEAYPPCGPRRRRSSVSRASPSRTGTPG